MADFDITKTIEDAARTRFNELQTARDLTQYPKPANIGLSRLYAHVKGASDGEISQALLQDLTLRRVYQKLARKQARIHMGQAIAASSQDYPERHHNGCSLRLQSSNAESDQLYLIIELQDSRAELPSKLNAFLGEEAFGELDLPKGRNGIIQTLIEKQSLLAQMLADPKTEVILT